MSGDQQSVRPAEARAQVVLLERQTAATNAPSRRPVVDLTAFLTGQERAKLDELAAIGIDEDVLSRLVEETCRPRLAAAR